MSYQFGNTLYATHRAMLNAVVYDWWTAGGQNSPEVIDGIGCSPDGVPEAIEMVDGWDLDKPSENAFTGEEEPSWTDKNGVSLAMLAEVIRTFWVTRPDRADEREAILDTILEGIDNRMDYDTNAIHWAEGALDALEKAGYRITKETSK